MNIELIEIVVYHDNRKCNTTNISTNSLSQKKKNHPNGKLSGDTDTQIKKGLQ